jgi:hypothetical protein
VDDAKDPVTVDFLRAQIKAELLADHPGEEAADRVLLENQTIIRCDVCDHLPTVDVARVRITDAGRRELAERAK